MSVSAHMVDGKWANVTTPEERALEERKSGGDLDKDAFLQLLVAQMKYQDPLEPTSNTEYISQLATFSELEEMQNMGESFDLQRASALVGKEVIVKVTSDTGKESYESGKVDYVVMENGKPKLSINETLHDLDALDTVCDSEYLTAYTMASDLIKALAGLPGVDNLSMSDKDKLQAIVDDYEAMNDYQKTFVATEAVELLDKYKEKMKEVEALAALAEEDAKTVAGNLTNAINELPSLEELTVDSKDKVSAITEAYEKMDSYQKSFLEEETVELMQQYQEKMEELLKATPPAEEA